MTIEIGIRKEDKNVWERRVPLTPRAVADLREAGVSLRVESFPRRAFSDDEYRAAGASIVDDVGDCDLVLGIKEIPKERFRPGGAYMFFSHTIKGQPHNMAMLRRLVELGCTLIDYELVKDDKGRRLIFFGRHAGLAGMIDTLWALGKRLERLGVLTPFANLEPAHAYPTLKEALAAVAETGRMMAERGLPREIAPLVVGFAGYGNVSQGAQEVFDVLPHVEVSPADLAGFIESEGGLDRKAIKVVYREEHLVAPRDPSAAFDLQEYYDHPERYRSIFEPHLSRLSVLVNGIFWTDRYPRLATREQLKTLFAGGKRPKLVAVGDISCDVDGALACTVRDTTPGDPTYVYDPVTGQAPSGFDGPGVVVMAVSNLPCELPVESSTAFSAALEPYVTALANMDLSGPLDRAGLPEEIRRAVILWHGEFAPGFEYMQEFLRRPRAEGREQGGCS